ncbi:MAG: DUF4433 domain-containing protein, partial [Chloroflexi bacterium]|nr:DUF4433 domain-containing protein [Chloroflexota bacterium]
MNLKEKPDAKQIRDHISALKTAHWLGPARSRWPDFLFHFTDIRNAVSILQKGELLSREEAKRLNAMVTDSACQEIIANTDERLRDYVRLYFRPRTPTQFRNEGFRPVNQRWKGAHCPVPIYFLFDSRSVLCRQDTLFSEGNLAAGTELFGDASHFRAIPFEKVYHDSSVYEQEETSIIFHRHAEVAVPRRLDLSSLRYIWCRSEAEYTTLLYLLNTNLKRQWVKQIGAGAKGNLFFGRWTYVEEAQLSKKEIVLSFNRNTMTPGPFVA